MPLIINNQTDHTCCVCSYGQSAGSSRLYDTVDTAELMKSLSSQGTKTAGGQVRGPLADSTDAELSEALR